LREFRLTCFEDAVLDMFLETQTSEEALIINRLCLNAILQILHMHQNHLPPEHVLPLKLY